MPLTMRKLPGKSKWRVRNKGKIVATETTKTKAQKQVKLLRGLEHGLVPRKQK